MCGWKIILVDVPGTAFKYGGDDIKKIMRYLSGTDVSETDATNEVDIATPTTYDSDALRIRAPTSGFNYIIRGSNIAADRIVTLPNMGSDGTISLTSSNIANDWGTNMQTFRSLFFQWANPNNTFFYKVQTGTITANRMLRIPILATDDDFVFAAATQTLSNKTLVSPNISLISLNTDANTIKHSTTNNSGDLLASTGTKYDRFARGTANQFLATNPTGTGIQWRDISTISGGGGGGGGSGTGDFQFPIVNNTISGAWYGTSNSGGTGMWTNNLTDLTTGTGAQISDSSGRIGRIYTLDASDEVAGFRTNNDFVTRTSDPELFVRYKMTLSGASNAYRVAIGFISNVTTADFNTDQTLNNQHGFMWYKDEGESTIHIAHNDGDATQNNDSNVSLTATNESIHTIRLFSDSTNNRFGISLDGATAFNISTEIPSSTQRLGCFVRFHNENSSTRLPEIYGAYFKCKVLA